MKEEKRVLKSLNYENLVVALMYSICEVVSGFL